MRSSFDKAFEIIIGLEGKETNDPDDPGGFTRYGIAQKYNPEINVSQLTLDKAKEIYLLKYWIPSGCDSADYPFDICLFDGAVNPQGQGNKEILPCDNWQEFLIKRMVRYMKKSHIKYVKGHIFRVLRLYETLKHLTKGE